MPFDPQYALGTVLPLAEAAYDLTKLPVAWKPVATIQPDNFGFVATRGTDTVICFRGTQTQGEWFEDFDALAVGNDHGPGIVHQGFQRQWNLLRESVYSAALYAGNVLVTGHSLGAALAVLCAADLVSANKRAPLVYTLAGPRVGWSTFAKWFSRVECYSIENVWDVVPHAPPHIEYCSQGTRVQIDGGKPSRADGELAYLRTAHSLPLSYGPGLKGLLSPALPKAA